MGARYGQHAAQDAMKLVNKELIAQLRQLTGADSESVKAAASVLRKQISVTLSTPGANRHASLRTRRVRGTPSAPGQPPAMQGGKLAKSVKSAVVDGVRRVGFDNFRARIQEFGAVVTSSDVALATPRKRGRHKGKTVRRAIVIPPRPFMERSLNAAQGKMADVVVGPMQKLGEGLA